MTNVITLKNVTKYYGSALGVEDVSLKVAKGSVFGFLGPNGAGKSTTIGMMVDLMRPSKGSISILGMDSVKDSVQIRQKIGFLAGDIALDKGLTGWQQLEYFGNLRKNFDQKYVEELAERLDCKLEKKFKTLSRGNKQKVGLIAALMHRPEMLILDEPTSGLDPLIQAEFNKIILDHKAASKTAFISSHILSEVQEICDEVTFIREGKIVAQSGVKDLSKGLPKHVVVTSKDKKLASALRKLGGFEVVKTTTSHIEGSYTGDITKLVSLLAQHQISNLRIQDTDLESVFMQYYGGPNA